MQIILVLYPEFIPLGLSPAIKPTHQIGHKNKKERPMYHCTQIRSRNYKYEKCFKRYYTLFIWRPMCKPE